ncbi:uncharacterized protein F5147DRAFT_818684, partial [Suillus discolor]
VTDYLEKIDPTMSTCYIEYLIDEKGGESPVFHDWLAELYLNMMLTVLTKFPLANGSDVYSKLLRFIDRLHGLLLKSQFQTDTRMNIELIPCRSLPSASCVVGLHTLLELYLRPTGETAPNSLRPALDLISRHCPRLDSLETLQLLPPLVTALDVRPFLQEAL